MNKVLIVWSEVPKSIAFIELEVSSDVFDMLKSFHNVYINADDSDDEIVTKMNNFFYPDFGSFAFTDKIVKGPISGYYNLIIHCGILS